MVPLCLDFLPVGVTTDRAWVEFPVLYIKCVSPESCPTLRPQDCSPPGSSVHEIFQARILEWAAISSSRGSSRPRDQTRVSCTAGRFFTAWAAREACVIHSVQSVQWLSPTLCDPMNRSSQASLSITNSRSFLKLSPSSPWYIRYTLVTYFICNVNNEYISIPISLLGS